MNPLYAMLSPRNQEMMARADREAQAETAAAQARHDDFAMRCITLAPLIRQQNELAMAEAEAAAVRADKAAEKARAERETQLDDYRFKLQLEGKTWRTPQEVLRAAAGVIGP